MATFTISSNTWLKIQTTTSCWKIHTGLACIEARLAIEVDGGQHNEMQINDYQRTAWLEAQGWKVLRFWNTKYCRILKVC
ncbi:MAG TPA: DUF559 domain-containing protein [Methylotenera sp.]